MPRHNSKANQSLNKQHWQAHIKALEKSGLTRAEYCRQHELSYHAMIYWQRKIPNSLYTETTLVPVPLERILNIPEQTKKSCLIIRVTDKLSVEVGDHFSTTTLERVLSVLEGR